jgi:sulfatase maturation enzyme AslB (radical SAM superfamily)
MSEAGAAMREFNQLPMREMIFLLTEKCNLRCVYCYEEHKNKGSRALSPAFIKDKIHAAMVADDGCGELWFDFFGGEPLLEFETIREVVDWFLATNWPRPAKSFRFLVTTNATLLTVEMKRWFTLVRDHVTLGLSMDGTKAAQDRNRSNSYDAVIQHVEFFRRNWPLQPVKMTVGPDSIDQVYEGVLHLHSFGLQAEPDVVFEDVWGTEEEELKAAGIWAEQLDGLVRFYHAHPELRRPLLLSRRLTNLFNAPSAVKKTFCGAGRQTTSFMPDGAEYPCFRFGPIAVDEPLKDIFAAPDIENTRCAACPYEKICPTCEGHNYFASGSCFQRTDYHCRFFKASLVATAKLMLLDHPGDLGPVAHDEPKEARRERMRRLLAIRLVSDDCVTTAGSPVQSH